MVREGETSYPLNRQDNYTTTPKENLNERAIREINAEIDRWYELLDMEYVRNKQDNYS